MGMPTTAERILTRYRRAAGTVWTKFFEDRLEEAGSNVRSYLKTLVEMYAAEHEKFEGHNFFEENAGDIFDVATSPPEKLRAAVTSMVDKILTRNLYMQLYDGDLGTVGFHNDGMVVSRIRPEGSDFDMDVEVPEDAERGIDQAREQLVKSGAKQVHVDFKFTRSPHSSDQKRLVFDISFSVPFTAKDFVSKMESLFLADAQRLADAIPAEDWGATTRARATMPKAPAKKTRKR